MCYSIAHPAEGQEPERYLFDEHTFFLDRRGLNIVEPVEAAGDSGVVVKSGQLGATTASPVWRCTSPKRPTSSSRLN
jgi:hypothetical protein